MPTDYIYSENSRRPATLFGLALFVAILVVSFAYGAPWFIQALVGIAILITAPMVLRNRRSGMELIGSTLRLYAGKWVETIAVSDISEMHVTRWTDGAPSASLLFASGKKISIPGYCVGSVKALEATLASRSILTRWNP
jgi:hypothetical protein